MTKNIKDKRTHIEVRHGVIGDYVLPEPVEFIETVHEVEIQNEPDDSLYECHECNECETCDESTELT